MSGKRQSTPRSITSRGVEQMRERERVVGLEADDEAARWLGEHDPAPLPVTSKSARKSKTLHRWKKIHPRR